MIKVENNRGAEGNESINKNWYRFKHCCSCKCLCCSHRFWKIIKKVSHVSNRYKVKKFVDDKFDGNQKLLSIVDDLSDDELDSVLNVVDRVKDGGSKLAEYGEKVKDNTDSLKERFFTFIEDAMK